MPTTRAIVCVLLTGLTVAGCAAPSVTTRSLLAEMTDLRRLAEFPDPPFTCKQLSSYDPRSKAPDQPEAPTEGWFANADAGHYLRVEERGERQEHVMMDADGPGAIVRIWSANPKGTLRVYLDGSESSAIEAPMADLLGGKVPGIPARIACERSKGWNSYFPIPYARHCKVTSDEGGFYYHVNYRTYEPGTEVVSFDPAQLKSLSSQTRRVARVLDTPREAQARAWLGTQTRWCAAFCAFSRPDIENAFTLPVGRGESKVLAEFQGPRAISELELRAGADDLNQGLRQLLLEIVFDGEKTVSCPLGDFFGAAPGVNPFASLPVGVTEDGTFWSHWVMPFKKNAVVRVRNVGVQKIHVAARVTTIPYHWTDRSMHFHAKWRTEFDVPTRPMQDWNYLTARGKGVFVGAAFAIANPTKTWWGEGDEKIYVDGETFPSHFGTGTEDYYGYAWGCNEPFTHAYHNQPRCDGPGNYGHTAVNRWHILDCVPFRKDFRFDMELWHWADPCRVTMSVVAYWYARPGGQDDFPPIQPADLELKLLPKYVVPKVAGAIEGESMRIIEKTAVVEPQPIDACSNESHLWWHQGCKVGDRLVLGFDVPQAGRFCVRARFVKARDYGIVRMSINGLAAGGPIDLYNDGIVVTDEIDLGTFDLPAGENLIGAEIVGANDQALKQYLFGLDYVRLEPVQ